MTPEARAEDAARGQRTEAPYPWQPGERFGFQPDEDGRCEFCRDLEVVLSGTNSQHHLDEASCTRCGRPIPVQIRVEMTFRSSAA